MPDLLIVPLPVSGFPHEPDPVGPSGAWLPSRSASAYLGASQTPSPTILAHPLPLFGIAADGISDIGQIRKRNEDSLELLPELCLVIVADGMGGHPGGDVASRTAAKEAGRFLSTRLPLETGGDVELAMSQLAETMEAAVLAAHQAVRLRGEADPDLSRMGTTLTAMAVDPLTGAFGIGHVGDSRTYRLRQSDFLQITRDDTWVQDRLENEDITVEQAKRHPFGHLLTQCVGLEDAPEPRVVTGRVEIGDTYLVCTDGLVGMLEDESIVELLLDAADEDPKTAIQRLVDAANESGGHDNVTAALVRVIDP